MSQSLSGFLTTYFSKEISPFYLLIDLYESKFYVKMFLNLFVPLIFVHFLEHIFVIFPSTKEIL